MIKQTTVVIDAEMTNLLEGLDYECVSRKDLISFMLSNNMRIDTVAFKDYQNELKNFQIEFNKAKQLLEEDIIIPAIHNKKLINWNLSYKTNIITIFYEDDNE